MPSIEVTIADVAAGGDGLGHAPDGRVVFARGGLPGDRVRIDVTEERTSMVRGLVTDVLDASPDRTDPPCPHVAEGCGGCGWQHVDPGAQPRLKARIAEEALRRIGKLSGEVAPGPTLPSTGYRTSVRCLVVDGRAAFRRASANDPVPVEDCMVAHAGLRELIATARFGSCDEVTLRIGASTGERLALVEPSTPPDLELPDDVRTVGVDEVRAGRRAWIHDVVQGRRFRISAESFFQTRSDGAAALVDVVRDAGDGWWGSGHLIDLYGGVGLFSSCLGEGMQITSVEASRAATSDARHNLGDLEARVVRSSVDRWQPSPADIVVADPPRAGLGAPVVDRVVATSASRVVLVSCDPASFARDSRLLTDAGYERISTVAVDLFPHTPHIELVSRFDRHAGARGLHG